MTSQKYSELGLKVQLHHLQIFTLPQKSFHISYFDSESDIPYMLDKNQIIFFYKGNRHKGIITSTENDTLNIKWPDIVLKLTMWNLKTKHTLHTKQKSAYFRKVKCSVFQLQVNGKRGQAPFKYLREIFAISNH